MEAIILAGGRAERLGDAARGKPKSLVEVAGRPLVAYQVGMLAHAGVDRIIVACAAGQEELFENELSGLGPEVVAVGEREPLGRGGGIRFAAQHRRDTEPFFGLNGDELIDIDFGALAATHRQKGGAATIVVAPLPIGFGVVDVDGDGRVKGFDESPRLPYWANAGIYVLEDEAVERFPERGDHERTTFPELAAEGRLFAHRHEGIWLTVNTPKDLRVADDHVRANPEWLR